MTMINGLVGASVCLYVSVPQSRKNLCSDSTWVIYGMCFRLMHINFGGQNVNPSSKTECVKWVGFGGGGMLIFDVTIMLFFCRKRLRVLLCKVGERIVIEISGLGSF